MKIRFKKRDNSLDVDSKINDKKKGKKSGGEG